MKKPREKGTPFEQFAKGGEQEEDNDFIKVEDKNMKRKQFNQWKGEKKEERKQEERKQEENITRGGLRPPAKGKGGAFSGMTD